MLGAAAGTPLPFFGAQALYFAAPVLDPLAAALGAADDGAGAAGWAAWLEEPAALAGLAAALRERQ